MFEEPMKSSMIFFDSETLNPSMSSISSEALLTG